jgi:DNA repair protein RadC
VNQDNQHYKDRERLAVLIERHTGISRISARKFLSEYGAGQMLPCANILCKTDGQRKKLAALFEFKNLYEIIKDREKAKGYVLGGVDDSMEYFCNYFADIKDKEHVVAAYLNTQNELILTKQISSGTLNEAAFVPREIIKEALFCNADAVIVAHNHPSGSTAPSRLDIAATGFLHKGLAAAGVKLHDHIIVAGGKAESLANMGHIPRSPERQELSKAASSLAEKPGAYAKTTNPPRIKEQLMMAEKQLARESISKTAKTKNHGRGNR